MNPHNIAVAASGYRIQSQTLHIPDRYGFFSSGPSRAQAIEGSLVVFLTIVLSLANFMGVLIVLLMKIENNPNANKMLITFCPLASVVPIGLAWVMTCRDRQHEGGLKLRKE